MLGSSGMRDAVKRLALRQPGGIRGLAARMGVASESTFYHKLNGDPGHNLSAEEVELATAITKDPEVAQHLAQLAGWVCIPMGVANTLEDEDLYRSFAALCKEVGDVSQELNASLGDGVLSANEKVRLETQVRELLAAGGELLRRIEQRAARDAQRPALRVAAS